MTLPEIWLFGPIRRREQRHLLWVSADRTLSFPAPSLGIEQSHHYSALRDGLKRRSVGEVIGAAGENALATLLADSTDTVRLRIALRPDAQQFSPLNLTGWEWLHVAGGPLGSRAVIERYASVNWQHSPHVGGDVVVLDTWFDRSGHPARQSVLLDTAEHAYRLSGLDNVRRYLASGAFAAASAGIVVAHGNPRWLSASRGPFLAPPEPGTDWDLGDSRVPPVVLLLVCGDDQGSYVSELAPELLARGARCVIAPTGVLNRSEADRFLTHFIQGWERGQNVSELLHAAQHGSVTPGGPRSLCLVGDGSVSRRDDAAHRDPSAEQFFRACHKAVRGLDSNADTPLDPLLDSGFADVLHALALQSVHQTGSLDAAAGEVLRLIPELWRNDKAARAVARALNRASSQCKPVNRAWLSSIVSFLEECYGQGMLRKSVREAQAPDFDVPRPRLRHFQARGLYRLGAYEKSAQTTLLALEECSETTASPQLRHELLADFAGYLIDLNLGAEAEHLCLAIRPVLDPTDPDDANQLFTLRDRLARARVGTGHLRGAIAEQKLKRTEAPDWGLDGRRELAWLLFLSAWSGEDRPAEATLWAAEVRSSIDELMAGMEPHAVKFAIGNDPLPYLVRAAAVWHWQTGDYTFRHWVDPMVRLLEANVSVDSVDPGPIGIASAALLLSGCTTASPTWQIARSRMEEWRYYQELAVLERLLGQATDAMSHLQQFHALRARALQPLPSCGWPPELGESIPTASRLAALEERERLAIQTASPDDLRSVGLIPM